MVLFVRFTCLTSGLQIFQRLPVRFMPRAGKAGVRRAERGGNITRIPFTRDCSPCQWSMARKIIRIWRLQTVAAEMPRRESAAAFAVRSAASPSQGLHATI
jgi:hypothetical protein